MLPTYDIPEQPRVLDRRDGPNGEVVLRQHGELLQIIANGCFLMDTSDGRSERLLLRTALEELTDGHARRLRDRRAGCDNDRRGAEARGDERHRTRAQHTGGHRTGAHEGAKRADKGRDDRDTPHNAHRAPSVLIGGLGVGFSLAEAAAEPRWGRITVIERERAVIDWHRDGPLARVSAGALGDPRTTVVHADLLARLAAGSGPGGPLYDALCLDIDNGPDWTVTEDNGSLYMPAGLAACARALTPGGVLALWSAQPSPAFEERLRNAGFENVRTEELPVARGVPDVIHLAVKPA